jgi:hypothetical protein
MFFSLLHEHEFKQIESPAAEKVKPCGHSNKYPLNDEPIQNSKLHILITNSK